MENPKTNDIRRRYDDVILDTTELDKVAISVGRGFIQ